MELKELSHADQVALVALVESLAIADGGVSEGEEKEIGVIASELGDDTYRELLDEAERAFPTVKTLKTYLRTVKARDVQEALYATAMEEVMGTPSPEAAGYELLDWLAETWKIEEDVEKSPDEPK